MARRGRECVVAGCERKAAVGSVVCAEHRDTALGEQTDREIIKLTQRLEVMARYEEGEEKRAAAQEFRRQVMRGDYAVLFSSEMLRTLTEAGKGYDLQPEIGMMRMAMLRLMLDEENPSRLAHGLAKLSGALGKSMERQAVWDKAARDRRRYRAYVEASHFPSMAGFDEDEAIETRGRVMPTEPAGPAARTEREAVVQQANAVIETIETALGSPEPVNEEVTEPEDQPAEWPRAGYPDYYLDVEELQDTVWGKGQEESGGSGRGRIARGR
jgi:hypothetical protein